MDDWLDEQGLYRKNNALDGTCLFRAVAEQLMPGNPITGHLELRCKTVKYMKEHRDLFEERAPTDFDEYMDSMALPKTWAGPLELDAISLMYKVDFEVFHGPEQPIPVTGHNFEKVLYLCVTGNTFYDAVYRKSEIQNLGFCQSIVYHILYENVFKLEDLDYAVDKMLHDKAARAQRERYLSNHSVLKDENDLYLESPDGPVNVKQVLDSGAILFPYKVAKALDPDIYRNTEFDTWVELSRGKPILPLCVSDIPVSRRSNFWYGNGGPLRLGVKCHVRVEENILTGHIQEMSLDSGPVVVYIEELSKKITVPYESLIPVPRSSLRPDWSYSLKHQMISKLGTKERPEDGNEPNRRRSRNRRKDESATTTTSENDGFSIGKDESESEVMTTSPDSNKTAVTPVCVKRSLIVTPTEERAYVNTEVALSEKSDGSDLPYSDVETLRFFFNLGIEYFRQGTITYQSPPIITMQPVINNEEYPQMVTGNTMYQAASTGLPAAEMVMPSSVQACQGSPILSTLPPITFVPPAQMEQNNPPPPPPQREQKERGRRFAKAPRFQRLEHADSKHNAIQPANYARNEDEVQHPDISSTTLLPPPPAQLSIPPAAVPVTYQCPTVTYAYSPEGGIPQPHPTYPEGQAYVEQPYIQESVQHHAVEASAYYVEASPEVNYQYSYPFYSQPLPLYYH